MSKPTKSKQRFWAGTPNEFTMETESETKMAYLSFWGRRSGMRELIILAGVFLIVWFGQKSTVDTAMPMHDYVEAHCRVVIGAEQKFVQGYTFGSIKCDQ